MAVDVLIGIALVLGIMILIHEWGHFVVARWCGVRVDVFSIGFGPRLFGVKRGPTDYRVSLLPLGGYVRMAGQDPTEIDSKERYATEGSEQGPTGAPDELMSKSRWQRVLIAFAGPAVNLAFPVLLLAVFFGAIGVPYSAYEDRPVQVTVLPSKAAGEPGSRLSPGDKILGINDLKNPNWGKAQALLANSAVGSTLTFEVENGGSARSLQIPIRQEEDRANWDRVLGFAPIRPILDDVVSGYPAARAGLREGDKILTVDGQPIQWWGQFTEHIRGSQGRPVHVEVDRNGKTLALAVTPTIAQTERGDSYYQIGVQVKDDLAYRRVPVTVAASLATSKTWDMIAQTVDVVGKLVRGRVSVRQLQGAVGISHAAGQAVRKGPLAVVSLMVLISVNLGVLNLLPIPILDGGQILLLTIEGIRRRDLSLAFKERFVQVGLVFLLVLFAYVMYNDVVRLLPGHS